jgi:hypothetical protein
MLIPTAIRLPLKMILFPIRLFIAIFTGAVNFIIRSVLIRRYFGFASVVLFFGFLVLTWSAIFINTDMTLIARIIIPALALMASYIFNPATGALKYIGLLTERMEALNGFLKI